MKRKYRSSSYRDRCARCGRFVSLDDIIGGKLRYVKVESAFEPGGDVFAPICIRCENRKRNENGK